MWPRMLEIFLGLWLMMSPWIIGYYGREEGYFFRDMVCGTLVITLALLSWWHPTRWAHYLTGGVALFAGLYPYFAIERPGPPAAQNEIMVAILLLTIFLLPNNASDPPEGWRRLRDSSGDLTTG